MNTVALYTMIFRYQPSRFILTLYGTLLRVRGGEYYLELKF